MPQQNTSCRGFLRRVTSAGVSKGFFKPILDNLECSLQRPNVQVFPDDREQTAEDATSLVTIAVEHVSQIGLRTGTTSDQTVENKNKDKDKVVLPKLDLDTITDMMIDGATHTLANQILAFFFQGFEHQNRECIG